MTDRYAQYAPSLPDRAHEDGSLPRVSFEAMQEKESRIMKIFINYR